MITDAQSVKNKDPAALKDYDAGKKVSGRKGALHFAQGVQDILGGHATMQIDKRSELHTL